MRGAVRLAHVEAFVPGVREGEEFDWDAMAGLLVVTGQHAILFLEDETAGEFSRSIEARKATIARVGDEEAWELGDIGLRFFLAAHLVGARVGGRAPGGKFRGRAWTVFLAGEATGDEAELLNAGWVALVRGEAPVCASYADLASSIRSFR